MRVLVLVVVLCHGQAFLPRSKLKTGLKFSLQSSDAPEPRIFDVVLSRAREVYRFPGRIVDAAESVIQRTPTRVFDRLETGIYVGTAIYVALATPLLLGFKLPFGITMSDLDSYIAAVFGAAVASFLGR
mmetsp:Transcript_27719/g.111005  ORF Transcript_27719/g.111005 Transcript_27719/m.111005 type:complete len:129 (-) Transcript_27719:839-1225(-)